MMDQPAKRHYNVKSKANLRQYRPKRDTDSAPMPTDSVPIQSDSVVTPTNQALAVLERAAPEMADTVVALARAKKTPAAVRLAAASKALELAGVAGQSQQPGNRLLDDELSEGELSAFLLAGARALELRAARDDADDAQVISTRRAATAP